MQSTGFVIRSVTSAAYAPAAPSLPRLAFTRSFREDVADLGVRQSNMRALKICAIPIAIIGILLFLYALPRSRVISDYFTPIIFYGKVVDEQGTPISGASVDLSFCSNPGPGEGHIKTHLTTDSDGLFSSLGHGLGVVVMVSKQGYYRLPNSDGNFGYVQDAGRVDRHSSSKNRAVFVLRRMGKTEPLIVLADKDIKIQKDGTPIDFNLSSGRAVQGVSGDIKVETWINDQGHQVNSNLPYDWHCIVSVPGGGLIPREGEFNFVAPESGYQTSDEINMPAALGPKWRSQVSRNYFVKLKSGNYARLEFTITAGGEHFFTITSYLNPSGSRNLEYAQNHP